MAPEGIESAWCDDNPVLVQEIEGDLREHYPTLRLAIDDGRAEVRGTFPILDEDGGELDRWEVSIILPRAYPKDLPIVRETGGRIPADRSNHVLQSDGTACVLLPETRYKWFPRGARFRVYLDGPMTAFFANQSHRARGGRWVHDEWDHGPLAAVRFYRELLGPDEEIVAWRALIAMGLGLREEQKCPCGRGKPIGSCHSVLLEVRDNLGQEIAQRRLVEVFEEEFKIKGVDAAVAFLRALRKPVRGHHPCPCGSGKRVRGCHSGLRKLNGAMDGARSSSTR